MHILTVPDLLNISKSTLQNLDACFLTFHSLSSSSQGTLTLANTTHTFNSRYKQPKTISHFVSHKLKPSAYIEHQRIETLLATAKLIHFHMFFGRLISDNIFPLYRNATFVYFSKTFVSEINIFFWIQYLSHLVERLAEEKSKRLVSQRCCG